MLKELYNRIKEEEFEDLFQPHGQEELDRRYEEREQKKDEEMRVWIKEKAVVVYSGHISYDEYHRTLWTEGMSPIEIMQELKDNMEGIHNYPPRYNNLSLLNISNVTIESIDAVDHYVGGFHFDFNYIFAVNRKTNEQEVREELEHTIGVPEEHGEYYTTSNLQITVEENSGYELKGSN